MPLSDVRTADAVRWESLLLSGPGEELHIRVFQAGPAPGGWLVWAHGGSWRSGSVAGWHSACADLARTADATVVGVDYRLAPDHPHPAALEDVLTAMDWAQQQSETPIAVGGDSAGGTIAASAALIWRDRQRPLAAQVLAYPPMDPACRAQSFRRNPEMFPSRAGLLAAWQDYRGTGRRHPVAYSTPYEAQDLGGVAPAILAVGTLDPVADDVRDYARRLRSAEVPVEMREFEGMPHGTFLNDPALRHWLGTTYARRAA